MINYKIFPLTELQVQLPCSEKPLGIPVINRTHSIQISHLILFKWTFIFKSLWGSSQYNESIYAGRSGVQILARARELSLLQNIQISSSTHSASNSSFSLAVNWPGLTQSDHSHSSTTTFKNQWSYTSTHPVHLHGKQGKNFVLPQSHT